MSWKDQFESISNTPPTEGAVLTTVDGSKVKILIEFTEGKAPFMYAIAYVPCIVGAEVGWFCRSVDDSSNYGYKCILLPKARERIIRTHGIANNVVGVKNIRVVRQSKQGKSLLVELCNETHQRDGKTEIGIAGQQPDIPSDVHQEIERGSAGDDGTEGSEEVCEG